MPEGHTGIKWSIVEEANSPNFRCVLAYLRQGDGRAEYVIHCTSHMFTTSGLQPRDFLGSIGLTAYEGECPILKDHCYFHVVAAEERNEWGVPDLLYGNSVVQAFRAFALKVGRIFELHKERDAILRDIGLSAERTIVFGRTADVTRPESAPPPWVEAEKTPRLKELERNIATANAEAASHRQLLPLLFGTDSQLVDAVKKAMEVLGLVVEKTDPGFTVDLLAKSSKSIERFGIEVTGIDSNITKKSPKLTQVVEFERIKEHGYKTVLLACTFNKSPLEDRKKQEHFTKNAVDFLSAFPIVMMTAVDLYRLAAEVLAGTRTGEDVVKLLYEKVGVVAYAEF